jgi:hypothetical protein
MTEQQISIDYLIEHLCNKKEQENTSDTITNYCNDADILDLKLPSENQQISLKGMLKDDLVKILLEYYEKKKLKVTKTFLRAKGKQELIDEIIKNKIKV